MDIKEILSKYIADKNITDSELKQLRNWLDNNPEVDRMMAEEWNNGDEKETDLQFSAILKKIQKKEDNIQTISLTRKVIIKYQKIAAIILLPVLVLSSYIIADQFYSKPTYFQTAAERGQKSRLVLPDGSIVWLNSDSYIRYPDNFGKKGRSLELVGEAYFEVTKNPRKPFVVEAGEARIKVLGTTFNLKAYPDEDDIETTLFEGKVELTIQPDKENLLPRTVEMQPGESLLYDKTKNQLNYLNFKNDEIIAWTNNQLIFRNDNFENLVKKIERWYNVEIVYDKEKLNKQRLTVELYQGELLDRLLDIIELAMNVDCTMEKDKIIIKPRIK